MLLESRLLYLPISKVSSCVCFSYRHAVNDLDLPGWIEKRSSTIFNSVELCCGCIGLPGWTIHRARCVMFSGRLINNVRRRTSGTPGRKERARARSKTQVLKCGNIGGGFPTSDEHPTNTNGITYKKPSVYMEGIYFYILFMYVL